MNKKALTLIELTISAVLFLTVVLASSQLMDFIYKYSQRLRKEAELQQKVLVAMLHIKKNVKSCGYIDLKDPVGTASDGIELFDSDGNLRCSYQMQDGQLKYITPASTQIIADNINSLAFKDGLGDKTKNIRLLGIDIATSETGIGSAILGSAASPIKETAITFAKLIKVGGSGVCFGYDVSQLSDGNYILTGKGYDVFFIKKDIYGNTVWAHEIDIYDALSAPFPYSIVKTPEGYAVLGGYYNGWRIGHTSPAYPDIDSGWYTFLVRIDESGNLLGKQKNYGNPYDESTQGTSQRYTVDTVLDTNGNFDGFIIGSTILMRKPPPASPPLQWPPEYEGGMFLIRTDTTGEPLWQKRFESGAASVCQTFEYNGVAGEFVTDASGNRVPSGFLICGVLGRQIGPDNRQNCLYAIKTGTDGSVLWQKAFGGGGYYEAHSALQADDGNYIIAGSTSVFGSSEDAYLVKLDDDGNTIWQRTYGGSGEDRIYSVDQSADGGYIMAGQTNSFNGRSDPDIYLIKTDGNGDSAWQRTFGYQDTVGYRNDYAYSVRQALDGGYIILGYTQTTTGYRFFMIKTDTDGSCPKAANPVMEDITGTSSRLVQETELDYECNQCDDTTNNLPLQNTPAIEYDGTVPTPDHGEPS